MAFPKAKAGLLILVLWIGSLAAVQSAAAGQPILPATDYPVPKDAIFVSKQGGAGGDGTRARPYPDISTAVRRAAWGSTIVIGGGTYRESLPPIDKLLKLQPLPGERVWLKGSVEVDGWRKAGAFWVRQDWQHFHCGDCFHPGNIDPEFPHAGLPDQLFIDGRPLRQVTSPEDLGPGAFLVDARAGRVLLGDDPAGHTIEMSVHANALTLHDGSQASVIRGLGFAHYSPVAEPGLGGAVKIDTDGVTIEGNVFAWSAVKGLSVFGRDVTVSGNIFVHNGMMGLAAWKADGLTLDGNRFAFNNREGFARSGEVSEAAGAKITRSRDIKLTGNLFEDNFGTGLWLDLSVNDARIVGNLLRRNHEHGLFFEISAFGVIASNVMTGNGRAGLALANANQVQVFNNTLIDNTLGLVVQDDGRRNPDQGEIARGIDWAAGNTVFANNILADTERAGEPLIWVRDFTGALDAAAMLTLSDHNGFVVRQGQGAAGLVEWWSKGKRQVFDGLAAFQAATGRDKNSVLIARPSSENLFADPDNGDFSLVRRILPSGGGLLLPEAVADAMGWHAFQPPGLGALNGFPASKWVNESRP